MTIINFKDYGEENSYVCSVSERAGDKLRSKENVKQVSVFDPEEDFLWTGTFLVVGDQLEPKSGNNYDVCNSKWVLVEGRKINNEYYIYLVYKEDTMYGSGDNIKAVLPKELTVNDIVRFVEKQDF